MDNNKPDYGVDLIEVIANIYLFAKRKFWLLLIFLSVGLYLGVRKVNNSERLSQDTYKKELFGYSPVANKDVLNQILISLQQKFASVNTSAIDSDNIIALSKDLKISPNAVKSIVALNSITTYDKPEEQKIEGAAKFELVVNNSIYLDSVVSGIINYLNTNKYISDQFLLYINEKKELAQMLDERLNLLDSLEKQTGKINTINRHSSDFYNNLKIEEFGYWLLFKEKQKIEKTINQNHSGFVYIDLNSPVVAVSYIPVYVITIFLYALGGLVVGSIVGGVPLLVKHIKKYLK
jgi:hypothetical protein